MPNLLLSSRTALRSSFLLPLVLGLLSGLSHGLTTSSNWVSSSSLAGGLSRGLSASGQSVGSAVAPAAAKQAVAESASKEQAVAEPAATEQAVAEPAATEQAVAEPAATEHAVAELAATEPAASQPAASQPRALETPASRPAVTPEQRSRWGTMFEGALLDSDNGKDFRETEGYYKLLTILQSYTGPEVTSRTTRFLDWTGSMADPNAWRGEFVRRRGVFAGSRAIRLDRPVQGIVDIWRCTITDGDATDGVIFDLLEPPPSGIDEGRSAVEVEGIFYRTVHYETSQGYLREAPYLLVKNIRKIEKGEARTAGPLNRFGLIVVAAALLFFGFWLALVVRQQVRRRSSPKREQTMRELFEQRLRRSEGQQPRPPRPPPPVSPP
jgi:hypothetical protein